MYPEKLSPQKSLNHFDIKQTMKLIPMKIVVILMVHDLKNEDFVKTWTKNKSIQNMMNANNIILWLMKEMKLKRVNI